MPNDGTGGSLPRLIASFWLHDVLSSDDPKPIELPEKPHAITSHVIHIALDVRSATLLRP